MEKVPSLPGCLNLAPQPCQVARAAPCQDPTWAIGTGRTNPWPLSLTSWWKYKEPVQGWLDTTRASQEEGAVLQGDVPQATHSWPSTFKKLLSVKSSSD